MPFYDYQIAPLSQVLPRFMKWMTSLKISSSSFNTAPTDEPYLSLNLAPILDSAVAALCKLISDSPTDTKTLLDCILPSLTKEDSLSPLICAPLPPLSSAIKASIWVLTSEQVEMLLPAVLSLPITPNLTTWAIHLLERYKHMVCEEQSSYGDYIRVFERWKVVSERMVTIVAQSLVLRKTRFGAVQLLSKLLGVLQGIARPFVGIVPLLYDTLKRYLEELDVTTSSSFNASESPSTSPLPSITAYSFAVLQEKSLYDLTQVSQSDLPPDHISTPASFFDDTLPTTTYQLMHLIAVYMEVHEGHSDLFLELKTFLTTSLAAFHEKNFSYSAEKIDLQSDAWNFVSESNIGSNKKHSRVDDFDFDSTEQYSVLSMADVYTRPNQLQELKESKIRGLLNLGNTCYMNAVLQTLFHTVEFRNAIFAALQDAEASQATSSQNMTNGTRTLTSKSASTIASTIPTHRELAVVFAAMMASSKSSVSTHFLKSILPSWLRGYEQQDASEFERTLLDVIDSEWLKNVPARLKIDQPPNIISSSSMEGIEPTPNPDRDLNSVGQQSASSGKNRISSVNECFGGKIGTYVRCKECHNVSERVDDFSDLTLPFPQEWLTSNEAHNIDELLEHYFKIDTFEGAEEYFCEHCQRRVQAEKVERIVAPPRHLIVLVGRFSYDSKQNIRNKLSTRILYEEVQSIPIRSSKDNAWETILQQSSTQYALYGCVIHHGSSPRSGHYVSYARNSEEVLETMMDDTSQTDSKLARWRCFNDNQVNEMTFDKVLQGGAGTGSGQVYILYYVRTDPPLEPFPSNHTPSPSPFIMARVKQADAAASQAADGSRSSRAALRTARTLGSNHLPSRYHRDDRPDGPGSALGGGFGGRWVS